MARTAIVSYRVPQELIDMGITNLWDFRTGYSGANSTVVSDMIGGADLEWKGTTALSTVYTAGQYKATVNPTGPDYFVSYKKTPFSDNASITKVTFFAWFKPALGTGTSDIVGYYQGGAGGMRALTLSRSGTSIQSLTSDNGANLTTITTDTNGYVGAGTYMSLALVYDGGAGIFKLYKNGIEAPCTPATVYPSLFKGNQPFSIACSFTGAANPPATQRPCEGDIGIVCVAKNTALTTAQVLNLHSVTNAGSRYL